MSEVKIYKCQICGNMVNLIKNGGGQLVCCGKPMQLLEANTVDAAKEKHVPVAELKDGKLSVSVGSVPHPMTEEHLIEWILVSTPEKTVQVNLKPGDAPNALINADGFSTGEVEIYEYCNLHGLWKTTL